MDPLPPESSDEPKENEATPLLQDETFEYDDTLYAIGGAVGGSTEIDGALCGSTAAIIDVIDDSTTGMEAVPVCVDEATYEAQIIKNDLLKFFISIWLQYPPRKPSESELRDIEFFSTKAKEIIIKAWRRIRTEGIVPPEPEEIVQGLTEIMVGYIYPKDLHMPEPVEEALKDVLTARVARGVAESWKQILEAIEKEDKEIARKKRERRRRIRERIRKSEEVAEVLRFYAHFARMDYSVPLNCRTFCNFLCQCFSVYVFQIPIHTLLLSWPISIGVMGGMYMTQCPMSHFMPYMMMALGVVGTVALLLRLSFVIYQKFSENEIRSIWPWIVLKVIEFAFLDFLIIQLYYFFSGTPSFDPASSKYCNKTFYTFVHWINYVSLALVSSWIFVYFTKGLLWFLSRKVVYRYR